MPQCGNGLGVNTIMTEALSKSDQIGPNYT